MIPERLSAPDIEGLGGSRKRAPSTAEEVTRIHAPEYRGIAGVKESAPSPSYEQVRDTARKGGPESAKATEWLMQVGEEAQVEGLGEIVESKVRKTWIEAIRVNESGKVKGFGAKDLVKIIKSVLEACEKKLDEKHIANKDVYLEWVEYQLRRMEVAMGAGKGGTILRDFDAKMDKSIYESDIKTYYEWDALSDELRSDFSKDPNILRDNGLIRRRKELVAAAEADNAFAKINSLVGQRFTEIMREWNRDMALGIVSSDPPVEQAAAYCRELAEYRKVNGWKDGKYESVVDLWLEGVQTNLVVAQLEALKRAKRPYDARELEQQKDRQKYLNLGDLKLTTANLLVSMTDESVDPGVTIRKAIKPQNGILNGRSQARSSVGQESFSRYGPKEDETDVSQELVNDEFLVAHGLPKFLFVTETGAEGMELVMKSTRVVIATAFKIGEAPGIRLEAITRGLVEEEKALAGAEGRSVDRVGVTERAMNAYELLTGGVFKLMTIRAKDQGTWNSLGGGSKALDRDVQEGALNQTSFNLKETFRAYSNDEIAKDSLRMWLALCGQEVGDLSAEQASFVAEYQGELQDMMRKGHNKLLHTAVKARMNQIGKDMMARFDGMDEVRVGSMRELAKLLALGPEMVEYRKMINTHQALWNPVINPGVYEGVSGLPTDLVEVRKDSDIWRRSETERLLQEVKIFKIERQLEDKDLSAAKREKLNREIEAEKKTRDVIKNAQSEILGKYDPNKWIPFSKEGACKSPLEKMKHGDKNGDVGGVGYLARVVSERGVEDLFGVVATLEEAEDYDPTADEATIVNAKPLQGVYAGYAKIDDTMDDIGNLRDGNDDAADEMNRKSGKGGIDELLKALRSGTLPKITLSTKAAVLGLPVWLGAGRNTRTGQREFWDMSEDSWNDTGLGRMFAWMRGKRR
mgnify:CR=1 FL=1